MTKIALLPAFAVVFCTSAFCATPGQVDVAIKAEVARLNKDISQSFAKEFKNDAQSKKLTWNGYTAKKEVMTVAKSAAGLAIVQTLKEFVAGAKKADFDKKIDEALTASIKKDLANAGDPKAQLAKLQKSRKKYDLEGKRLGRTLADLLVNDATEAGLAAGRAVLDADKAGTLPKTKPELTAWTEQTAKTAAENALRHSKAVPASAGTASQ